MNNDPGNTPSAMFAADSAGVPTLPAQYPGPRANASSAVIGGRTTNWRTMTDAEAQATWEALRDWVEWFAPRYNLMRSIVPACWFMHGQLVEELSALHCAHRAAFDPSDNGNGPVGWHERLAAAMPRLREAYYGTCSEGHSERPVRVWQRVPEEQWTAWTTQSHAH